MAEDASAKYSFNLANFNDPKLAALLKTHHATVTNPKLNVPGQKMYALDMKSLQSADIQLWTISTPDEEQLLGCAALKNLNFPEESAAEVKSMHTVATARGKGIGASMVGKLEIEAKKVGIKKLYLETGSQDGFSNVRRFYKQQGFIECGTFADYEEQENSVFMCKSLA